MTLKQKEAAQRFLKEQIEKAAERRERVVAAIKSGRLLREVGEEEGVSRERIRQICKRAGVKVRHIRPAGFLGAIGTKNLKAVREQDKQEAEAKQNRIKEALLAGKTLEEIAQQEDIKIGTLRAIIRKAGIRLLGKWKRIDWSPELDALLGTCPDIRIAKMLDCCVHAILARRRKLGIPSWQKYRKKTSAAI